MYAFFAYRMTSVNCWLILVSNNVCTSPVFFKCNRVAGCLMQRFLQSTLGCSVVVLKGLFPQF